MRIEPHRTARMLLRPLEERDRAEWVRMHGVGAEFYAPWIPALGDGESWDDVFDREVAKLDDPRHLRLGGFLSDGRIAGLFNVGEIVRGVFQCGFASWRTSAELLGRGYGTEGTRGLLDLAFSARGLGLHRVQANVIPTNVASLKLAERVGFRREGMALRYLQIGGEWMDHVMLAKLAEEHTWSFA